MAVSEQSSSLNPVLTDRQLSGNRYGRFGSGCDSSRCEFTAGKRSVKFRFLGAASRHRGLTTYCSRSGFSIAAVRPNFCETEFYEAAVADLKLPCTRLGAAIVNQFLEGGLVYAWLRRCARHELVHLGYRRCRRFFIVDYLQANRHHVLPCLQGCMEPHKEGGVPLLCLFHCCLSHGRLKSESIPTLGI